MTGSAERRRPSFCRALAACSAFAVCVLEMGGPARGETFKAGDNLRFEAPAGFCAVEPDRGGHHAEFWERFAPPRDGSVTYLAVGLDCATLSLGRLQRPRAVLQLMEGRRPPDLRQASRKETLDVLEARYRKPPVADKTPVLGRDNVAIYLDQGGNGVTAFAFTDSGRMLVLTVLQFDGSRTVQAIHSDVVVAVKGLVANEVP